jgi:hypothetical protein
MYKKALAIEPNNLIVVNFIKITEAMMWVERLTKKIILDIQMLKSI